MKTIRDARIQRIDELVTPDELIAKYPVSDSLSESIYSWRTTVNEIIKGKDQRLLAIVGPCSIHDPEGALEYASKLKELAGEVSDQLFIVMRTYFEKARTVLGWKGLIMDPCLDDSNNLGLGLELARKILVSIDAMGLPVGCEFIDPIVPQYIDDLVVWASIGARTSQSQLHRSLASGLSTAVGFKNATDGDISVAVNSIKAAEEPSTFIGITRDGRDAVVRTMGNDCAHLILRGGDKVPNYYEDDVKHASALMKESGIQSSIIVDCSHGNSHKDPSRQGRVLRNVIDQYLCGQDCIRGFMLESYLYGGSQELVAGQELKYGVSVTDPCLGWDDTKDIIIEAAKSLRRKND